VAVFCLAKLDLALREQTVPPFLYDESLNCVGAAPVRRVGIRTPLRHVIDYDS
jgi:hypothetical protein